MSAAFNARELLYMRSATFLVVLPLLFIVCKIYAVFRKFGGYLFPLCGNHTWMAFKSNYHYDEKRIIWEVWNEINLGREHNVSVEDYLAMYSAQVHAMTDGLAAFELGSIGGPWKGTVHI